MEDDIVDKIVRNVFLAIAISATVLLGAAAKKVADFMKPIVEAATPIIEEDDRYKLQTYVDDKIRTLPVGKEGVNVLVNDTFTPEQKKAIAEAISELDDYLLNVDYNIYLDPNQAPDRCITFDEVEFHGQMAGFAGMTCFKGYPYYLYPIKISIDADKIKNEDGTLDIELFKAVVKHEMLHTLGLGDIYDKTQKTKTIMYHEFDSQTPRDLTQEDIDFVNSIYTDRYVNSGLFASTQVQQPIVIGFEEKKSKPLDDELTL